MDTCETALLRLPKKAGFPSLLTTPRVHDHVVMVVEVVIVQTHNSFDVSWLTFAYSRVLNPYCENFAPASR